MQLICYLSARLADDEPAVRRAALEALSERYADDPDLAAEEVEAFLEPLWPDCPPDRRNYDGGSRLQDAQAVAVALATSIPDVRREQERLSR